MSREASLKPVHLSTDKWCVSVPPALSETGKRYRRYFDSKGLATGYAEELKARRHDLAASLGKLTVAQVVDARGAYDMLTDYPELTLCRIAGEYLAALKEKSASIPFLELYNRFLEAKAHRTAKYLRELKWVRDRLQPLHAVLSCDITTRTLEPLLDAMTPSVRNATLGYLKAVLNFGLRRHYLSENPATQLEPIESVRKEVEIIPAAKVQAMLENALADDLELLPFLVLGFFCGVRPQGELSKIHWRDIDMVDRVVTVRPEVSKTRRRRFIDLPPNAVRWLEQYQTRGGNMTGLVAPFASKTLQRKRQANCKAAGVERWPISAMRHTFCSCWLSVHGDVNRLVLQSGHSNVETMWESYHRGVRKTDAQKFWEILPPVIGDDGKIVYLAR